MAGLNWYEKAVLVLTAGFVLFAGGCFLTTRASSGPCRVTVQRQELPGGSVEEEGSQDARPPSLMEDEVINVNTADVYELQRLPGIGEKRAQAIVEYREAWGPFQSVDELDRVPGIGEGVLEDLRGYAAVG